MRIRHLVAMIALLSTPALAGDVETNLFHDGTGFHTPIKIGSVTADAVIDTGATRLSVCRNILDQAGIAVPSNAKRLKSLIASGEHVPVLLMVIPTVEFAGITLTNVSAVVHPPRQKCKVLIGLTVLMRLKSMTLDGQTLTLRASTD